MGRADGMAGCGTRGRRKLRASLPRVKLMIGADEPVALPDWADIAA